MYLVNFNHFFIFVIMCQIKVRNNHKNHKKKTKDKKQKI
jgi:hypothetical protein